MLVPLGVVALALPVVGRAANGAIRPPSSPAQGVVRAEIERVRAVAPRAGLGAGRVVLLVRVRYDGPGAELQLAPDSARSASVGRLLLNLKAGGRATSVDDANELVRDARRQFRLTHQIVLGRAASRRALSAGRLRVAANATQVVRAGGRGLVGPRRTDREASVARVVEVPSVSRSRPRCEAATLRASYSRTTRLSIVCMGEGVRVRLGARPRQGRAQLVSSTGSRAVVTYRPSPRFVGADRLMLRATAGRASTSTAVRIAVQPYKLRALGDSVTAGFGYLGDGTEMLLPLGCTPLDTPNDRCSSNSNNGINSDSPLAWSPDFGLSNRVAWPAQFAVTAGLTGNDRYENRAVSGTTATDWASGFLHSTLQGIVADMPDLVVFTLGGNPLLDDFLFNNSPCDPSLNGDALRACVQSLIDQNLIVPNIQSVLLQLLAAPNTRVVVSQYHLALPSLLVNVVYQPEQLESMIDVVNQNISQAASDPRFGGRVFVMTPPRFNTGLGPGTFTCPGSDPPFTVDGPSHQSEVTQDLFGLITQICTTTDYWIISGDTGIHPSIAGHAQYAQALAQLVQANNLLPPLP
jgi:lysophospholipase L1-like esterase